MDLNEKDEKKGKIKRLIEKEKKTIKKHEEKLNLLIDDYYQKSKSELPILLFNIDITFPNEVPEPNKKYLYIYYFPDFNTINSVVEYTVRDQLPNTIDLSRAFESLGMPKSWPGNPYFQYLDIIKSSSIIVQKVVKDIIDNKEVNSWNEVRKYLEDNIDNILLTISNEVSEVNKVKHK